MRIFSKVEAVLDAQRGDLFPWAPVFFGLGIGIYFALRLEPGPAAWSFVAALALFCCTVAWRFVAARLWMAAILLILGGVSIAGCRAYSVAEPVLGFRYYGPIEGRIVAIDRSASDALRLTLDGVVMRDMDPSRTPTRVRVSLHGQQGYITPEPGLRVIMTGHLSPPGGPVEPGGFDFQRHAWFQSIGAVGYTRTPVLTIAPYTNGSFSVWITRVRLRISAAVQDTIKGRAGGFAAAITTGDRAGMDQATLEALRASNLAHLLAISGLHMGLLTGFVFAAARVGLSLCPRVVLVMPAKKIAALLALVAGAIYLALSGGNVATERAFIMVAVMFLALLVDRRAITLRAVAVAALIVLTLRPEALYGPGFQMSFAATTALVAVFGGLRAMPGEKRRWPKWASFIWGVALSSFVAGLATAPIAAAHFNQVPHYGLIANILSVPLMGAIIIPGAVLAAILAPIGGAWIGLSLMKPAILWILNVAETVAGWDGAVSKVIAPSPAVLPL
ncbi:MAG: ComEC/Rec2 family competence protein, partial [Paracoccaceae bacterium]